MERKAGSTAGAIKREEEWIPRPDLLRPSVGSSRHDTSTEAISVPNADDELFPPDGERTARTNQTTDSTPHMRLNAGDFLNYWCGRLLPRFHLAPLMFLLRLCSLPGAAGNDSELHGPGRRESVQTMRTAFVESCLRVALSLLLCPGCIPPAAGDDGQPTPTTQGLRVGDTDYNLLILVISNDPALDGRVESILFSAFGKTATPASPSQPKDEPEKSPVKQWLEGAGKLNAASETDRWRATFAPGPAQTQCHSRKRQNTLTTNQPPQPMNTRDTLGPPLLLSADRASPPCSPAPVPVLTVSGAADASAISWQYWLNFIGKQSGTDP